ncbi:MAG: hypothetical protein A2Z96_06660 [Spirochaetes bacterium GWB1_48_6]|nr:MAG: hypothetical protein A2Z96_06660 [Spirochaetes bacterium GWB1_48_6]
MAQYQKRSTIPRILLLLLIIALLAGSGMILFDLLGLINARAIFLPVLQSMGWVPPTQGISNPEDPMLLDKVRLVKDMENISLWREELDQKEKTLTLKDEEILQKLSTLAERELSQEEREKVLNDRAKQYDIRKANLEQNARYLNGMPPQASVDILLKMDDQDVVDTLRTVEELAQAAGEQSIVSYWISLMPPDRAATLQRKMASKPSGE